jgi:hypothetical protein
MFVALVTQHAKRMSPIVSVACSGLPHFSTLCHKRQDFRKKVIEYKVCTLTFSITFAKKNSHFKKNSARYYHICV